MESIQKAIELAEENGNEELVKQLKEFVILKELPEGLEGSTKEDVIKNYLKKHKPDWNVNPQNAFQCACVRGELQIAKWVYVSFNLTIENARGDNKAALRWAARKGHLQVVKYLIEEVHLTIEDARVEDNEALRWAAYYGRLNVVKYLIKKFDILTPEDISSWDKGRMEYQLPWQDRWPKEVVEYLQAEIAKRDFQTNLPEGLEGNSKEDVIKNYLSKSAIPHYPYWKITPRNAFQCACRRGELEIAKWVYMSFNMTREDARARDNYALRYAAENGHLSIVKYLIKVFDILTPEDIASWNNFSSSSWQDRWPKEVVEYLQAEIAKKDFQKSLPEGLEGNSKEDVISNYLRQYGWDVTPRNAFRCACEKGKLEIAKWVYVFFNLIIEDARIHDNYALIRAAEYGHLEVVKYLIEEVHLTIEDARACDNWALGCAAENGHHLVVKYLIEKVGLGVDVRTNDNWALRWAAHDGHLEVVKYLVEFGLDIEDARACDNWALRCAAENGHHIVVKYLIEEVHLTIEDARAQNNYAMRWAAKNGHLQVVKYLIEKVGLGVEDVRADDDNYALRMAAYKGHRQVVKYLIEEVHLTINDITRYYLPWDKNWSKSWQERWPKEVVEYLQAEIAKKSTHFHVKATATDLRKIAQSHQKCLDDIVEKLQSCAEKGVCQLVVDTISDAVKNALEKSGYKCQTLENDKIRISF